MSAALRWGILGAAKFARQHMAPAIHAARGSELVALATSNPDKADGFRAFAPSLDLYDGYESLLADEGVAAVYIPLPNHLHVEWALKALRAGKHVLVEKPLAMRAEEFDEVIALRDETGLLAAEAFMIVHHPQWQRARALIADGAIGRLLHVDAAFSYDNAADEGNIRNRPETGGGGLADIGVYIFGGVRFATGEEPERIRYADIRRENGVDVFARIAADFGTFSYNGMVSMRMFPRQEVVFHGSAGVLRLTCPFNANVFGEARLEIETAGMQVRTERFPGVNHYVLQVENFTQAVRDGAEYPCSLEFSRGTQAMIDMVLEKEA